MCLFPFAGAPLIELDDKAWAYMYLLRSFTVALLVPTVCFFTAFHWVDGVTDLLIFILSAISFWYRTQYGLFIFSVVCMIISYAMFEIWAIVRLLMHYAAPRPTTNTDNLVAWQKDTLQVRTLSIEQR